MILKQSQEILNLFIKNKINKDELNLHVKYSKEFFIDILKNGLFGNIKISKNNQYKLFDKICGLLKSGVITCQDFFSQNSEWFYIHFAEKMLYNPSGNNKLFFNSILSHTTFDELLDIYYTILPNKNQIAPIRAALFDYSFFVLKRGFNASYSIIKKSNDIVGKNQVKLYE
jgi:hypothetical protein